MSGISQRTPFMGKTSRAILAAWLTAATVLTIGCTTASNDPAAIVPIPSDPPSAAEAGLQERYSDASVVPAPLTDQRTLYNDGTINDNLFIERNGIHDNSYNTDASDLEGPDIDSSLEVVTHQLTTLFHACPTVMFSAEGKVITTCIGIGSVIIYLLEPDTLEILAREDLPPKVINGLGVGDNDSSGGGYTHLLSNGNFMIAPSDKTIRIYDFVEDASTQEWDIVLVSSFDLTPHLPEDANVTDAAPDYSSNIWFTTSTGIIGYVTAAEAVVTLDLGVDLQNQIAMDASGVYFSTFERFYKVAANAGLDGIDTLADTAYDNSAGGMAGVLSPGTGTTPTLFGNNDDLVAITDNAAPQLHLNIYNRSDLSLVCSHPIFPENQGAVENSPVGYGNSVLVQNNRGWDGFLGDPLTVTPGLIKVSAVDNGMGGFSGCGTDWYTTEIITSSTPILSTANGLVYTVSVKEGDAGEAAHYFSAFEWATGASVFDQWVGNGAAFDPILTGGGFMEDRSFAFPAREGLVSVLVR